MSDRHLPPGLTGDLDVLAFAAGAVLASLADTLRPSPRPSWRPDGLRR